ncbi:hypothetical protein SLEP1_g6700 [Rubroshorea leprosula]|uniref:Uncharacterized protein n=1 Tax=Rubroshorea leprosula TaxID=152421 RepID=A0AAV5HW23_9ROSI|nr:hypothetical protein SLEP1_g6700 [Rubroshorea leprosula]
MQTHPKNSDTSHYNPINTTPKISDTSLQWCIHRPGCSSSLGHKKSTLVERQAPEAMATAVIATWVMVEAMATAMPATWVMVEAIAMAVTATSQKAGSTSLRKPRSGFGFENPDLERKKGTAVTATSEWRVQQA